MTDTHALRDLLAKVEAGKLCEIPTPHYQAKLRHDGTTARIMGYVEDYAMMRHTGAVPFCIHVNDVKRHIIAMIAQGDL